MQTKVKQKMRKMIFLNTHRLENDKYSREKQFIEKKEDYDHILAISRGRLRPQHI